MVGLRVAAQAAAAGIVGVTLAAVVAGGEVPWTSLASFAVMDLCLVVVVGGVSEHDRAMRVRYSDLVDGLSAVVWQQAGPASPRTFANHEIERVLGYPLSHWDAAGRWDTAIHPDDRTRVLDGYRDAMRSSDDLELRYRVIAEGGATVHVEERVRSEPGGPGRPAALRGVLVDVTREHEAQERIEQHLKLVDAIPIALVVLELTDRDDDRALLIRAANPEAALILGREVDQLTDRRAVDILGPSDDGTIVAALADVVRTNESFVSEDFRFETHPSGRSYLVHAFPLPGASVGLSLQDVTERAMAAEVLRRQALHDGLTGLPNRTMLTNRMRDTLSLAASRGEQVALLLMDLDQFKEVNDALGHDHGDRLLVETARRLQRVLREADTVARLGGDEFAVLLTRDADPDAALATAGRIRRSLEQPFQISGITLQTNGSIGVAVFPDHADDAETLAQRADVAMYAAKRSGGGVALYSPDHDQSSVRRLAILGELRAAIRSGQLVLHYQPKLDLRTGELAGCEALVRWQHPEFGLIPPGEFIELAEVSGVIQPLTRWVLETAVDQVAAWRAAGLELGVAVNLSVRNLYDNDLVVWTDGLLIDRGVNPAQLTLEITESELMSDPILAMEVLGKLKALGIATSIDDFGTGYSSLSYLKSLPIDELKIDRSFVGTMTRDDSDLTIVRSTIDLSHNLGLGVVAEGVEDEATMRQLADLGCDRMQGYHLSRPIPGDELAVWARSDAWRVVVSSAL